MSSTASPSSAYGTNPKEYGTEGSTQPTDEGNKEKSSDILKPDKNSSWSSSRCHLTSRPRTDDAARRAVFNQATDG